MNPATQCGELAAALPGVIDRLGAELQTISKRMAALKRAGLCYASLYCREGKYVYLNHPIENGNRKREYVGTDQRKIEAAKKSIARGVEYAELSKQLKMLESRLNNGQKSLNDAIKALCK